jgi:hypothetical protein
MPKEVRLNDKMWFGRHKGRSIKEIIDCDYSFLYGLILRNKIIYNKNVIDYLSKKEQSLKSQYINEPNEINEQEPVVELPDSRFRGRGIREQYCVDIETIGGNYYSTSITSST